MRQTSPIQDSHEVLWAAASIQGQLQETECNKQRLRIIRRNVPVTVRFGDVVVQRSAAVADESGGGRASDTNRSGAWQMSTEIHSKPTKEEKGAAGETREEVHTSLMGPFVAAAQRGLVAPRVYQSARPEQLPTMVPAAL